MRAVRAGRVRKAAKEINHNQAGDPLRLAQAMLKLVDAGTPPLRLPMGTDTLKVIEDKHAFGEAEVQVWRALSGSTDFPNAGLSCIAHAGGL